jgi:hypothetical protein
VNRHGDGRRLAHGAAELACIDRDVHVEAVDTLVDRLVVAAETAFVFAEPAVRSIEAARAA